MSSYFVIDDTPVSSHRNSMKFIYFDIPGSSFNGRTNQMLIILDMRHFRQTSSIHTASTKRYTDLESKNKCIIYYLKAEAVKNI